MRYHGGGGFSWNGSRRQTIQCNNLRYCAAYFGYMSRNRSNLGRNGALGHLNNL